MAESCQLVCLADVVPVRHLHRRPLLLLLLLLLLPLVLTPPPLLLLLLQIAASTIGAPVTSMLAVQVAGATIGNMICINNILVRTRQSGWLLVSDLSKSW
jgi:hypothetical protein